MGSRKTKIHGNHILHQEKKKKKKKKRKKRNTFLFIDKKYDNKLIILMCAFFFFLNICNKQNNSFVTVLISFFQVPHDTDLQRSALNQPVSITTAWLVFIKQLKTD